MALDDLKETIETLRERIQAHRAYLAGNETRTRQVLIDPMIRTLGWDVGDPDSVELEYGIKRKWADYALMGSGRPIAVIEAKSLGTPLNDDVMMQVLNYANTDGIDYMVVTNGDHWQMFDVFKRGQLDDRILMDFQLTRDEPYACALQALRLWRPNLASGEPPREATTPVLIEKIAQVESSTNQPEPAPPKLSSTSSGQKVAEPSNNGDWGPLTSLEVGPAGQNPPAYIKFPNSNKEQLVYWTDILVNAAQHLIETGKISAQNCPVKAKSFQNYLLHTEPVHSTDKPFRKKRKVGELWLQTNHKNLKSTACWLLENFGVSPSTVLVSTPQR